VLYDCHPSHPDPSKLWALADAAGATHFGANPTLTQIMRKMDIRPNTQHRFERLESVVLVGSPATPDAFGWVYDNVKPGLWVTSQSGGTEFCSGLLAGVPSEPVKAGMIDAPALGVAARISQVTRGAFVVKPGSLFPALRRLEQQGLLGRHLGRGEKGLVPVEVTATPPTHSRQGMDTCGNPDSSVHRPMPRSD